METGPGGACFNMALDEAIASLVIRNKTAPTLRIYDWNHPSVTLGRFQRASDVDVMFCEEMDIPIVRRPTGGRAILHGKELTYSFSADTISGCFQGDLFSSYSALSSAFLRAFLSLGLDVRASGRKKAEPFSRSPLCFSSTSFGEITVRGRKIIGSAQRRWPGGLLQQGSIPLEMLRDETERVFIKAGDRADCLMGLRETDPSITFSSLRNAIVLGFRESLGVVLEEAAPSEEELNLAARLQEEKYQRQEWNLLK